MMIVCSQFGLGAGVLSRNISTALTLAHNIDSGTVWINTYGTVFPQTVRFWDPAGPNPPPTY